MWQLNLASLLFLSLSLLLSIKVTKCRDKVYGEIELATDWFTLQNRTWNNPTLPSSQTKAVPGAGVPTPNDSKQHRSKRFIYFNIDGSLDVGFLLSIPFTIILPPMSNLFNAWRYRRSINQNRLLTTEADPFIRSYTDRIQAYFELLKFPEEECHLRAMCEMSADPDRFYPLSELIVREIKDPTLGNYIVELGENRTKYAGTFSRFNVAFEAGVTNGKTKCRQLYHSNCPFSTEQRLNLPVLQFWKALQSLLNIKFQTN